MLVDDEPGILQITERVLHKLGYRPIAYNQSLAALEAFRQDPERFHLVLTDLTMPKLSGLELARQIHGVRADVPIILSTGASRELVEEQGRQAGVRSFLRKPYNGRELASVLQACLAGATLPKPR